MCGMFCAEFEIGCLVLFLNVCGAEFGAIYVCTIWFACLFGGKLRLLQKCFLLPYRFDRKQCVCVCLTGFSGAEPPGGQQPPTQGVWEAARPPPGGPQEAPRKHPGGPQEAPRRPTGRPQEATRKPPGGPPGPQEAPWRSPGDPRKATKLIVNANTSSAQIIISAASSLNCYCL